MAKKHFFQPLLPGFHSHLTIPIAFFSKHIEGRDEHKTMAKLRSDASNLTWKVKIEDGRRLTDGWKEFALAHNLRIGDIVIFRQEKDMAFHVSLFEPSCCEIQYGSCLDENNKLGLIQRKKKVTKYRRRETESLLEPSCFVPNVTPATLRHDVLVSTPNLNLNLSCLGSDLISKSCCTLTSFQNLPRSFVRANGLETRCGKIVLMNEKGTSWTLNLKRKNSCGTMYITRGWRNFCSANGLRAGSFFTFKLIQRGGTLVLRKSLSTESEEEDCSGADEIESLSTESDSDEESDQDEKSFENPRSLRKASSSPSQNLFMTLTLTPTNFNMCRLFLPVAFTRMHGINKETTMTMLDKNGVKWSTNLRSEKTGGDRIRLVGGWKEFFKANCVEMGESIIVKLIWEGDKSCVLEFCSKVKQETK